MTKNLISTNDIIKLVVLGAGKPHVGDAHSSLRSVNASSNVLDWTLAAFSKITQDIHFVGGYEIEKVMNKYSKLSFSANPRWESTGSVGSLFSLELLPDHNYFVSYSDIVYRPELVEQMLKYNEEIVVAVDSRWQSRYSGRSESEMRSKEKVQTVDGILVASHEEKKLIHRNACVAEFMGLIFFRHTVMPYIREIAAKNEQGMEQLNLSGLLEHLASVGWRIRTVDTKGDWAEINYPGDLAQFILGTKAQTLERLSGVITKSQMLEQISFTQLQWRESPQTIIDKIQEKFSEKFLAVRSSAITEDGFGASNAGMYKSLLQIRCDDCVALRIAIESVIESYQDGTSEHQILVQPMLQNVMASGVIFTRTLEHAAPYYSIGYDSYTGRTDTVTQGSFFGQENLILRKNLQQIPRRYPAWVANLIAAVREIETLVGYDALDIEFAVNRSENIFILQVRPIVFTEKKDSLCDEEIDNTIERAKAQFRQKRVQNPWAKSNQSIFGVMPDWNPAEIIGTRPRMLASTLYSYLITDNIWAVQRMQLGYRDVRPYPLMHFFAGHPYIDTRASFHSFTPAALPDSLAVSLVDYYHSRLKGHPQFHDKVEFEVLPTCYSFSFDIWKDRLRREGGFSSSNILDLQGALLNVTNKAFIRYRDDLSAIDILQKRFLRIQNEDIHPLRKALIMLYDCREFGTLPFAHLARAAFIAITLLRSAVHKQMVSPVTMDAFLNSIDTVTTSLTRDAFAVKDGSIHWDDFVDKYGHLRPGTYEITSPCYRDDPERFLRPLVDVAVSRKEDGFEWPNGSRREIDQALRSHGFDLNFEQWEEYLRETIKGREASKFAFSRNLSAALNSIKEYGQSIGLSTEDASFISMRSLQDLAAGQHCNCDETYFLKKESAQNRRGWELACAIEFPPLITDEVDFDTFAHFESQPNFIGTSKTIAPLLMLECEQVSSLSVECSGKIILLPKADPGYDWLFGQHIAGLITMYGGANSHMAIRAAEFGLPAAIGVGEKLYKKLLYARILELDCGSRRIEVIQ